MAVFLKLILAILEPKFAISGPKITIFDPKIYKFMIFQTFHYKTQENYDIERYENSYILKIEKL